MKDSKPKTVSQARALRKRMTKAEVVLWSRLRRQVANGMRFRRQHPVGPYVADFACIEARLVVEIDGSSHEISAVREHDRKRTEFLQSRGWRVLRVTNEDVFKRLDDVVEGILRGAGMPPSSG
jgi:very-short-patch-repair endonuclease